MKSSSRVRITILLPDRLLTHCPTEPGVIAAVADFDDPNFDIDAECLGQ